MWRAVLCLLLWSAIPGSVLAQDAPLQLQEGDRVRVRTWTVRGVFVVLGSRGDSVALQSDLGALHLPLSSFERLEISRGSHTAARGALRGAGIGFVIGAGTGAILGLTWGDSFMFSPEQLALGAAIQLGGAGMIGGMMIGAIFPGERWERVLPRRVGLSPGRTGALAISYDLSF